MEDQQRGGNPPPKVGIYRIFSTITIEPMLFLCSLAYTLVGVAQQQLIIYKTCLGFQDKYNFTDEYCDNINDYTNSSGYVDHIEPAVAEYNVINTIVMHVLPILLSFYLGAWTDYFGRKTLLLVTTFGQVIAGGLGLLNVYYIEWSRWWFLVSTVVPEVLTGLH